ncbi:MAG: hypothetical protein CMI24_05740 [Opitutae bacterium]|nr:hypothetical protein [Opitutae bacterium]MEC8420787.1 glycosyltransferase [Verrucomicrobiota bacterium]
MRLAVVTSEFPPINAAAAARIGPWVSELDLRGHQVKVFSSRGSAKMGNTQHYESFRAVPSNKVGIIRRFYQEMKLAWDLGKMLRVHAKTLDLVVITSPPFFLATHIAKIAVKKKIPYIFDIRDRYPGVLYDLKVVKEKSFLGRWLSAMEESCYKSSTLLTTVTEGINQQLGKFGVPHERVSNGFDGELFDTKNHEKKDDVFRVVYHGRFSRLHDIESLRKISLKVKNLNPEIAFMVIGPIPNSEKQKVWGNVEFTDEKKHHEIPALLANGSIGISLMKEMISTKFAMPAKVYEYIGMGLPLLVAPGGELCDFVNSWKIGLAYETLDAGQIAREIVALKADFQKYAKFKDHVISCRSKFDRRSQSSDFADFIEKYLNIEGEKRTVLN